MRSKIGRVETGHRMAVRRGIFALLAVIVMAVFTVNETLAQVEVDITEGRPRPTPIALPDFIASVPEAQQIGSDMTGVISNNLQRSGLFAPVNPAAFIERTTNFDDAPNFDNWRVINAEALVTGRVTPEPDGRIRVEFRLWDVFGGQQMLGQQYFTDPQNWRRVAHIISDAIYQRITGEAGYFDTRIVFVDETGAKDARSKRLAIMDQDGFNIRYLTDGNSLVLTPRFSPTNQEVTYMSYESGQPRVYLLNIETGQREVVGDFPGMTFAPRFSPDGQRVIMSLQQGGNANIYAMDLRSRQTVRLTNSPSIDTGPSFAPDGRRIVFESDRSGSQQIYVMGADGSGATRISQGEGRYSTPVWSPRGDLIAFTKQLQGRFLIGVMRPDGTGERILTEGFHNEGPTWAPNGRVLMFFRDIPGAQGGPQLWSVDLTGFNEQRVPTPSFGSDPAWSPLLN